MTRELALLIIAAVAFLLIASGVWAWRRRARRDSGIPAPVGDIPADAVLIAAFSGFYVATTAHDQPLERLAIRGLGFRSRVEIIVTSAGVSLDLPGQPRLFLRREALVSVDRATVAIDRVVERDGLVRLVWRADTDPATVIDSYLRPQDVPALALTDAVTGILPSPITTSTSPTGSAA